ncbi:preprotein translocase subunit SecE [Allokutzneria sp. A3M-2-11 16]|uniref:preprotein translocase subunit SecE n=1 Tax=Allokutzneria sp. A3M-2-11 16 TaxID=2962043 RepID=UPI0020B6F15F|nr:preprotein translocase subunit SecE [Allokutzneria sp. A3M-2-11 16]MCP3798921.1 preprotein translocase subunit SecE [Allokutzneria sp. A3M-2-11 16]
MSERSEQERSEGSDDTSRPVTAAARRERRGSARPASRRAAKRAEGSSTGDAKGKPTPSRDRQEQKKGGNPFKRFGRFLREVVAELRKVIWPTRKQLVTYTAVVLVFVAFMVGLVAGLDVALAQGVLWLFG